MRELDQSKLPVEAQTWVNKRLQYTHGYGVVMSPANEIDSTGLPTYLISNIPPQATDPALSITQPGIYYGQLTVNPVVANSKAGGTGEFDYPSGGTNVYTSYQGTGGVALNSWWRRLAYAVRFGDLQMLLSGDITPASRILYYRTVQDAQRLAPYLQYDADPYPVVSGGRIYWIWDAYTTSDHYPYSAMNGQINYIRNSVKVVIDAYNGTTTFYVSDPSDPIIQTYSKIFPGLYQPLASMPADLRAHIRYPIDFFNAQAAIYANYHVTDPRVFYNQEDVWAYPNEKYSSTGQPGPMDPFYAIMKLPGETQEEFVLVLPFTLTNRDNLVGWLVARCDGDHYGQLVVYDFPKDTNTVRADAGGGQHRPERRHLPADHPLGPARLHGDPGQPDHRAPGGQAAVRGAPVPAGRPEQPAGDAAGGCLLRGQVGDADHLWRRPEPVVRPQWRCPDRPAGATGGAAAAAATGIQDLARQANDLYTSAQNSLKAGDWAGYGKAINDLGQVLQQMVSPDRQA